MGCATKKNILTVRSIREYVRDNKGRRVGILVGVGTKVNMDNDTLKEMGQPIDKQLPVYAIGVSRCNTASGDVFSADRAFAIAQGRAKEILVEGEIDIESLPHSIINSDQIVSFEKRCSRYFKDAIYVALDQKSY